MGSSPCKRIHLLGIAHPVMGKHFQVLEVDWERKHIQDLSYEKGARFGLFMYFVIVWIEYRVLYMYMRSFVIKTYFWTCLV